MDINYAPAKTPNSRQMALMVRPTEKADIEVEAITKRMELDACLINFLQILLLLSCRSIIMLDALLPEALSILTPPFSPRNGNNLSRTWSPSNLSNTLQTTSVGLHFRLLGLWRI